MLSYYVCPAVKSNPQEATMVAWELYREFLTPKIFWRHLLGRGRT